MGLFALTDDEQHSLLKISRDILGEPARYMSEYDDENPRTEIKLAMWKELREQLETIPYAFTLSKRELRDVLDDLRLYGHLLYQENATLIDRHHISRAVNVFHQQQVDVGRCDVLLLNGPLLAAPPTNTRFVILQNVDVGPFKRMVHMVLNDDSVTDALHLSRQDVNDARRDILGGFVDAKHGMMCQFVWFQETTLRLLLDTIRYAIASSALHAPYARYKDDDFARFRNDLAYTLSERERPKKEDESNDTPET